MKGKHGLSFNAPPPAPDKDPLCDDNLAKLLQKKYGFEVDHYVSRTQVINLNNSKLQSYYGWVLIGTIDSNPLLKQGFGNIAVYARNIRIEYQIKNIGGKERHIWGITGNSRLEVHASLLWVLTNGLPLRSISDTIGHALKPK
ncbi:hypothetical protein ACFLWE_00135 [Chloroflexota bacterium]